MDFLLHFRQSSGTIPSMHFYGLRGKKIELLEAGDELVRGSLGDAVGFGTVLDASKDVIRLARATDMFFATAQIEGSRRVQPPIRPASVYRDARTKLLRCFYRELVIRFKPDLPEPRCLSLLAEFGLQMVSRRNDFVQGQVIVRDPKDSRRGDDLIEVANRLAERDDEIVFAAPNFVSEFRRFAPPAIPLSQWHLKNTGGFPGQVAGEDIRAERAWNILMASRAVIVAVIDDGIDIDHPALKPAIWRNPDPTSLDECGRDFFLDPSDPGHFDPRPKVFAPPFNDPDQNDIHGTPCAGLVGAVAPDGRAFGVGARCQILPVKVFHANALASDERVGNAIRYAAGIADVLSISWSGPETPLIESPLEDAVSKGRGGKGCAIFCATGNDNAPSVAFPASSPAAIAVGSSTDGALRAPFSNFGPEVAVVAPSNGGSQAIFTTDVSIPNRGFNLGTDADGGTDGLYTNIFGGTSASTPIAVGAAAVLLSQNAELTAAQVRARLEQTADKIGGDNFDGNGHSNLFGFGRVNLFAALGGTSTPMGSQG
jgi:subtilisin family serine protease